jgi:predicted PurR-regulated permease PerM
MHVDFALVLAIMSGVLELLPIIGPIIAGAAAALIALTISPLLALFVVVWYIAVQQTESHVLVPQIMKKSLGLNPITVILAILIGGKILGVIGIVIAVPVAVSLSIIGKEIWKGREGKWI